jgi:uncharacterized membrane protein YhaH (DUF805 family)
MQNRNPYAAPRANVTRADSDEEYGDVSVFSARGRLGRVRYIGYSMGLMLVCSIVLGIAVAATASNPALLAVIVIAGYAAMIIMSFLLTIQRAHDMNSSGWLALVILIPLVNMLFWFVPGTDGENNYGKKPPPNTTGVVVLACLVPAFFVLGLVAAVAIPAYQDYALRVAESAQQQ